MNSVLLPIEMRKKEIHIKKPWYEYLTLTVIGVFALFMLLIVLIMMITVPISNDFSNRDYYYISEVYGYSMYPTISNGDYVVIVDNDHPNFNIKNGDIVVYYNQDLDLYIAHRIVYSYTANGMEYFVTKGDNNNYYDDPITYNQIEGKVMHVIKNDAEKWFYEAWLNLFNWW